MNCQLLKSNHLFRSLFTGLMILGLLFTLAMCTNSNTSEKATEAATEETEAITEKVAQTSLEEGKDLFISYCVMCHGQDGKGEGPLAENLRQPPVDLTTITLRRGEFSRELIHKIIAGVDKVPGHSNIDMPAWFETFKKSEKITDEKVINQKIDHLVTYLESIQQRELPKE